MTKFWSWVATILISAILPLQSVVLSYAQEAPNLIANPSFEAATNGSSPVDWTFNSWGSTTAIATHDTTARTGSKSAKVAVSSRIDGDAKWMHTPVVVAPNKTYAFSSYYTASTSTELNAAFTMNDGSTQYVYLKTVPAASSWTKTDATVVVPASATHARILHIIYSVGDLAIDDVSLSLLVDAPDPEPSGSMIANSSFEQADGANPANWIFSSWGSNAATGTYESTGYDGSRSVRVTVSNHTDGDAKWYNVPIPVSENSTYDFSNYYKSTAPTETILQYTMVNGSVQYQWLGANPIASAWTQSAYKFTVPHDAQQLSVFHVMAQNGELWTDAFSLVEDVSQLPPKDGIVHNASLEIAASATQPEGWYASGWGENNRTFEYMSSGYDGGRSIMTTVTSYTDGDAKWYHDPVRLTPGASYEFSDYYKSNTSSRVTLAFTMQDGSVQYSELPMAGISSQWAKYTASFTMPLNAESVTVFHLLASVGFLVTDMYEFNSYTPTPFNRALVTFTFDDGWEDNISTALPMLDSYGFKSTQFYATSFIRNSPVNNARSIVRGIDRSGHEVHSHSVTHPDLTTLNSTQLNNELVRSKTSLESLLGHKISYFATPYGAYNTNVKNQIMSRYSLHRTVDAGFNSKDNFDISRLKVQNVLSTTSANQINAWVQQAIDEGTWLILVYHRVAQNPGAYDTTPAMFAQHLAVVDQSGVGVATVTAALAELLPQL